MFYPDLFRRSEYSRNSSGKPHSSYHSYREEINEDCGNRCVYCDITLQEIGYEGFQLDHFRPQKYFPDLISEPTNLVLSCPKCNRFKSSHWPEENSQLVFPNPFENNRLIHFKIELDGSIKPSSTMLAKYQIDLLYLNREARIQSRRKRMINSRINKIQELVGNKIIELDENLDKFSRDEIKNELKSIREVQVLLKLLANS